MGGGSPNGASDDIPPPPWRANPCSSPPSVLHSSTTPVPMPPVYSVSIPQPIVSTIGGPSGVDAAPPECARAPAPWPCRRSTEEPSVPRPSRADPATPAVRCAQPRSGAVLGTPPLGLAQRDGIWRSALGRSQPWRVLDCRPPRPWSTGSQPGARGSGTFRQDTHGFFFFALVRNANAPGLVATGQLPAVTAPPLSVSRQHMAVDQSTAVGDEPTTSIGGRPGPLSGP